MKTWIGIDPGLSGAVARVTDDGQADVFDVPTLSVKASGGKMKTILNEAAMVHLLRLFDGKFHATIENVHAMPGNGIRKPSPSSMFSFGQGFGTWLGILAALEVPYTRVEPKRWKALMLDGLNKGDKDSSRQRALQLFPQLAGELKFKKDADRAEALLIAEYGRRHGA